MSDKQQRNSYPTQKKSLVLRIIVIVIATFMALGAIAVPFLSAGNF